MCNIGETYTTNRREKERKKEKKRIRERKSTKTVDHSGGAHCITSTVVRREEKEEEKRILPFVLSDRMGKCTLRRGKKNEATDRKLYHKGSRDDDGDADDELYRL